MKQNEPQVMPDHQKSKEICLSFLKSKTIYKENQAYYNDDFAQGNLFRHNPEIMSIPKASLLVLEMFHGLGFVLAFVKGTISPKSNEISFIKMKNQELPCGNRVYTEFGGKSFMVQAQNNGPAIFLNVFELVQMKSRSPRMKLIKKHFIKTREEPTFEENEGCIQIIRVSATLMLVLIGVSCRRMRTDTEHIENWGVWFVEILQGTKVLSDYTSESRPSSFRNPSYPIFTPVNNCDRLVAQYYSDIRFSPESNYKWKGQAAEILSIAPDKRRLTPEHSIELISLFPSSENPCESRILCLSAEGIHTGLVAFVKLHGSYKFSSYDLVFFDVYKKEIVRMIFDLKEPKNPCFFNMDEGLQIHKGTFVISDFLDGGLWVLRESNKLKKKKVKGDAVKPEVKVKCDTNPNPILRVLKYSVMKELRNKEKRKKFVAQKMVTMSFFSNKSVQFYHYEQGDKIILSSGKYENQEKAENEWAKPKEITKESKE